MPAEVPLQHDLFTGEWVDNRTRQQKQTDSQRDQPKQTDMFSQREVAQFGVRANPVMPLSPGRLQLIREDPRTEEEIEADLMRQAQKNTYELFPSPENDESDDEDELAELPPAEKPPTQYEAYLNLVKLAEERAMTVQSTPTILLADTITLSSAKLTAQLAGLTGYEITAALTIGDFRGKAQRENQHSETPPQCKPHEEDIPILWTSRADMLKRRPDLAEKIASLRDDEIADLAGLVGQALEEFYWIQLNVVLALYLDHDLRLTQKVSKSSPR